MLIFAYKLFSMRIISSLLISQILITNVISANDNDYFQQEVNHTITVKLNDETHTLNAYIETEYINNSKDTLHYIYMHLWPNAHNNNSTAFANQKLRNGNLDFHFSQEKDKGFIDSLNFKINNIEVEWSFDSENPDIAKVITNTPLYPNDTIIISTPFRVKFPNSSFSRLGHNGQAYYATQWYPKPAVYDQYGWHPMPYLYIGEFYSEFGRFDVSITLPENYLVAASGALETVSEQNKIDSLANYWNKILKKHSLPDNHKFPKSSEKLKTIQFTIEKAHDFAWIADKRFYVISDSVHLSNSDKFVKTYGFFVESSNLWVESTNYINRTLSLMSEAVGHYPYKTFSAVQILNSGGANMEYPGLTTIGEKLNSFQLDRVIAHEAIHNWFYGVLGFNERKHPWLDEGFTTYYDHRYVYKFYPEQKFAGVLANTIIADYFDVNQYPYIKTAELTALTLSRLNIDKPSSLHSEDYDMINYFAMIYNKVNISISHLEKYLGTHEFDRIIRIFYNEWKFKHPYPEDLRRTFERESGVDLSWFFDDLIGSRKKLDYSIKKVIEIDDGYLITIENKGEINAPIPISAIRNDEIIETIWVEGFSDNTEIKFEKGYYTHFTIDPEYYTFDFNRNNNTYHINKIFPKIHPLHLQPFLSIENPLKTQIFVAPVIGWNKINGIMPGLAFYNQVLPFKSVELFAMPMFGLENNRIAGQAWAYKTFFSDSHDYFHSIKAGIEVKSYGNYSFYNGNNYFSRIQPSIDITFNPGVNPFELKNNINFRALFIDRDYPHQFPPGGWPPISERYKYQVYELSYHQSKNYTLNRYYFNSTIQVSEGMIKGWTELNYSFLYNVNKNKIDIRFFAGNIFRQSNSAFDYRFRLGSHSGHHDYTFDNTYLARGYSRKSIYYNQIYRNDGAFRISTPVGQTNGWLVACNLTIDLPHTPFKLFADFGTYKNATHAYAGSETIPYVLGVELELIKNVFSIYIPLVMSNDISRASEFGRDSYLQTITFNIRFDKLNPFAELKKIATSMY
jgi:hypothetical protein